ncbi:MAG: hypothetical protein KBS38_06110, partial [Bacteroidales bacterium]|nr:hypothetical protein [Candidatus Cacconaster caballi]
EFVFREERYCFHREGSLSACRKAGEDSTPAAGKPLSGKCVRKRNFSRLPLRFCAKSIRPDIWLLNGVS